MSNYLICAKKGEHQFFHCGMVQYRITQTTGFPNHTLFCI